MIVSEDAPAIDPGERDAALAAIRAGELVAYPTETVWGLGADARSADALERLRAWKGRDAGQPVSVLVSGPGALDAPGLAAPAVARRLAEAFWPGPLTLVVPGEPGRFAPGVARADGAVGLRCPAHPTALALARAAEAAGVGPLTATSLNRSGESPAEDLASARALCAAGPGASPVVVSAAAAAPLSSGAPSTVVDLTGARGEPELIREGAISERALAQALKDAAPE